MRKYHFGFYRLVSCPILARQIYTNSEIWRILLTITLLMQKLFLFGKLYIEYIDDLKYIYIYHHHHHHHAALLARISLTFSRHPSLSSIVPGKSSRLNPASARICCILVLAGSPIFAHPCEGSTRVYHLWVRPYFSSSVSHVWFV